MTLVISQVFRWLEDSSIAVYIRQSHVLYPAIETVHIIGFIVLTGSAFLFDLRLLGMSKSLPVTGLSLHLLAWSRRSLLVVIPSGFLLFMTQATTLGYNRVFAAKLVLILLAFANAAYFHRFTMPTVAQWDRLQPTPYPAKAAGLVSITLWAAVITCGRFLAYLE